MDVRFDAWPITTLSHPLLHPIAGGRAEDVLGRWGHPDVGAGQPIVFGWLDGHDWPYDDLPQSLRVAQEADYERVGLPYSKDASRAAHRRVAQLIGGWVAAGGVVVFDDTWAQGDGWDGKGGSAIPWLVDHGFDVTEVHPDTKAWHDGYVALRRTR